MNCWEHRLCKTKDSCPAYTMKMGNRCWVAAGTSGGREPRGDLAMKTGDCRLCNFYKAYGPGIPSFSSCCPVR